MVADRVLARIQKLGTRTWQFNNWLSYFLWKTTIYSDYNHKHVLKQGIIFINNAMGIVLRWKTFNPYAAGG